MKVVILSGGFGTRISEESHLKPKPMIEIGGDPIIWHIMKIYSYYGFNEFIICCGYKAQIVKEYFSNYYMTHSDVTYDFANGNVVTIHRNISEPWKVTVMDTGLNTMTGGRIKRVQPFIGNEPFMLTYGDGVSDVNLHELVAYHKANGKLATLTAVQPGGRFGVLDMTASNQIHSIVEKRVEDGGWINGGFMVFQPEVFDLIEGDKTVLEREPLERLAEQGQLMAYKHTGFWQCMDTLRDKEYLESLLANNNAPWRVW